MRFSKMLTMLRAIRVSAVVATLLAAAAGSGCTANVPPSDEQELRDKEKGQAATPDLHGKAVSMLEVSGGASEDPGGIPYCDQGEVFVGSARSTSSQSAACDAAREDAVRECEAKECFDRDRGHRRAFDCDAPPNACQWDSTWYGWYATFDVHGD